MNPLVSELGTPPYIAGLGILDELRKRSTRSSAHWTFDSAGNVLGYYGAAFLPEEKRAPSQVTNLRVPRNEVGAVQGWSTSG